VLFMLTSLTLSIMATRNSGLGTSVLDQSRPAPTQQAPATPAPAAPSPSGSTQSAPAPAPPAPAAPAQK
jgi:hypothetical protein